MKIKKLLTSMN